MRAAIAFLCITTIFTYGCSSNIENSYQVCDSNANRYNSAEDARAAGIQDSDYGATYCPEYKMHPSWDVNSDGVNDCEDDGSCNGHTDYMSARP